MEKKITGFQKTTVELLLGLVLLSLLLIGPVLADAGEMVAWGNDLHEQDIAQPCNDYVQVSAGWDHNLALKGVVPEPTDPTNVPEFPTIAVPLMLIVGLAGAIVFALSKQ